MPQLDGLWCAQTAQDSRVRGRAERAGVHLVTAECEGHGGGNGLTWQKQAKPLLLYLPLELRPIFHPLHRQGEGEEGSSP